MSGNPNRIDAKDLGINLDSKQEVELFKWFLACLLFGKPIQQEIAKKAYLEFVKEGLTSPDAIIAAGWDKLVATLDKGHYVRYNYSTATKLLEVCKTLKERYGSVNNLLKQSQNLDELQKHLLKFKGIGPVTTQIFLRDIEPILAKK